MPSGKRSFYVHDSGTRQKRRFGQHCFRVLTVVYLTVNHHFRDYIIFTCKIKSRRMRWAGHVARMGEERGYIGSWWGNRREGDHWGDLDVDGWIILG